MCKRKIICAFILVLACVAASASVIISFTIRAAGNDDSVKIRTLLMKENTGCQAETKIDISPGESISRIAVADNIGKASAWVRARVQFDFAPATGEAQRYVLGASGLVEGLDAICVTYLNTEDWIYQDGYWYYVKSLEPGETTRPLFTGLHYDGTLANNYGRSSIEFHVDMQATQAIRNRESVLQADGWSDA